MHSFKDDGDNNATKKHPTSSKKDTAKCSINVKNVESSESEMQEIQEFTEALAERSRIINAQECSKDESISSGCQKCGKSEYNISERGDYIYSVVNNEVTKVGKLLL